MSDAPTPSPSAAPLAPEAASPEASADAEVPGLVTRSTGSWYTIRTDDGEDVQARIRGKFRLEAQELDETNPLAVGDRVRLRIEEDETGLVVAIEPRENQLSRRAAGHRARSEHVIVANVDHAWCVQSTFKPKFNPGFVDRFLVAAEMSHIPAGIVLNKVDLMDDKPRAQEALGFWRDLYEGLGYPVLFTSAETGTGVDAFRQRLDGAVSVVSGPSGAGKSSLLNAVDPALDLRVGEVSEKTNKGKHTTTFATLFPVAGGWVADTPGIREFGIWGLSPQELGGYFVEFRPFLDDCRFPDCTHDHEPGCAIQAAVDDEAITPERYGSYLQMLESVRTSYRADEEAEWRRRDSRPDVDAEDPDEHASDL
ncbi:MAG: ribosome small subunit-dependent GTPase A [Bacteroidota bacterium]